MDNKRPQGKRGAPMPERRWEHQSRSPRAEGHRKPTEREELIENPNLNQAGNWAGSSDSGAGSQTGSDIDLIPDE